MRKFFFATLSVLMFAATTFAQGGGAATGGGGNRGSFITGALAVGIAAFGGALGDGRAIAAACEGTARNPAAGGRIFTMMLIGLALVETLVLFTFAFAFLER